MHMISMRRHIMQQQAQSPVAVWRHWLWLAVLVGTSVAFTLGLACAVPLAAFAAAAALTLSRQDALVLIIAVWLANQLVGFTMLDYPWTASTISWGIALGTVAVLATVASQRTVISVTLLGGVEIYTVAIQGRIFVVNAAAFAGLLVLHRLAVSVGFALRPAIGPAMTESRAYRA
jgi:hypothetical protein